jgi:SAM-dependent methyltransferase
VEEQALSFGPAAELYDTIRPSYPVEAVAWALAPLGPGHWRVADLGAGTGIMTRLLLAAGYEVVPVEPDALMRSRLEEVTAGVAAVAGTAEAIPVDDAGVDGAVAAQAYHWFDRPRAHAELVRAIRPGGVFAAIWNHRDESVPWAAEYSRLIAEDSEQTDHDHAVESYGPGFGPVERAVFRHSTRHTPESLVQLMQSRSYYLTASAARQRDLVQAILGLTRTHPDLAGRPEFDLPYQTLVFRAVRAGA